MAVDGRGGYWTVENMSELDELRARVTVLEAEVARLRKESATRAPACVPKHTPVPAARAVRDAAEVRPSAPAARTRVPNDEVRVTDADADAGTTATTERIPDRVEQPQSMTSLADAVGVMASGQTEHTRILRAHTRTLEAQSSTLARHGQFLESLLAGQEALQGELRRNDS
jgi:hypothetical protein